MWDGIFLWFNPNFISSLASKGSLAGRSGDWAAFLSLSPCSITNVLTVGCVPCKAEALNIRAAQKEVNLKVIQIGVSPYESEDDLRDFRKNFGSSDWIIGFDKDRKITELYKVRAVDTTILINAEGKIIYRDDGYPIEIWTIIDLLGKK